MLQGRALAGEYYESIRLMGNSPGDRAVREKRTEEFQGCVPLTYEDTVHLLNTAMDNEKRYLRTDDLQAILRLELRQASSRRLKTTSCAGTSTMTSPCWTGRRGAASGSASSRP